jgi:hypothetical protein
MENGQQPVISNKYGNHGEGLINSAGSHVFVIAKMSTSCTVVRRK